jgi:hypothetical protein
MTRLQDTNVVREKKPYRKPWNYVPPVAAVCAACATEFSMPYWHHLKGRRFCSHKCANTGRGRRGPASGRWKGGRRVRPDGYIELRIDAVSVLEHRHVMEQHLGRKLRSDEHVHHINENKTDNRLENLQVMSMVEHLNYHTPRGPRKGTVFFKCTTCGGDVLRNQFHQRKYANIFCNRECWRQYKRSGLKVIQCGDKKRFVVPAQEQAA